MRGAMPFHTLYRHRRIGLLAVLAPIVFAAGCSGGSGGSGSDSGGIPTFAFVSNRDGNQEIYLARNNVQNQIRLTNDAGADVAPSVSPDGTKVVFASNRDGNSEIYIVNSDGTGLQRLTQDTGTTLPEDTDPVFSPNGQSIAWVSTRGGHSNIWLMDATGANQRRLTNLLGSQVISAPAWSPNSSQIAFVTTISTSSNVRLVSASGGSVTTTGATQGDLIQSLTYNPAGTQIAFTVKPRTTGSYRIVVLTIATDAISAGPATTSFTSLDDISWSRDNDLLIFGGVNASSGGNQIFSTNQTGTQIQRLTTTGQNSQPAF